MKIIYKFIHKRKVEKNGTGVYSTKLLGFFSSKKKCEEAKSTYLQQPGFKDYPEDFFIEEVEADCDDYNDECGEFESAVFYLSHEYYNGIYDIVTDLGYYSTYFKAEQSKELYTLEPEFIEHPEGFYIAKYEIDKREWKEGFFIWEE